MAKAVDYAGQSRNGESLSKRKLNFDRGRFVGCILGTGPEHKQ